VPELADEIVDGSEPVAFIAATIVVVAATAATLVAAHSLDIQLVPGRIRLPVMLLWMGIVWFLLVAAPMLLARTVGPRILVAIWPVWRPLVAAVKPFVLGVAWLANLLGGVFGRRAGESDEPTVEEEVRQVVIQVQEVVEVFLKMEQPLLVVLAHQVKVTLEPLVAIEVDQDPTQVVEEEVELGQLDLLTLVKLAVLAVLD
jgi:hypothetical protein